MIDDFLPRRSWQPQQPQPSQLSPWLPLSHNSPFQPVITPSSTSISSSPPSTTTSSSTPVTRSSYSPPVHHDIDQVCICILMHCTRADKKSAPRSSLFCSSPNHGKMFILIFLKLNSVFILLCTCKQIIDHCQYLCESIVQRRNQWTDDYDPKPWLDDMIGRANEVLNALLRLRKQQGRSHNTDPIRVKNKLCFVLYSFLKCL